VSLAKNRTRQFLCILLLVYDVGRKVNDIILDFTGQKQKKEVKEEAVINGEDEVGGIEI